LKLPWWIITLKSTYMIALSELSQSLLQRCSPFSLSQSNPTELMLFSLSIQQWVFDVLCRIMDSIEECSKCADTAVCSASVACIVAMLGSLEELCTGKGITHTYMDRINAMYTQLDQCDYQGNVLVCVKVWSLYVIHDMHVASSCYNLYVEYCIECLMEKLFWCVSTQNFERCERCCFVKIRHLQNHFTEARYVTVISVIVKRKQQDML
jgi:hypothetical protein